MSIKLRFSLLLGVLLLAFVFCLYLLRQAEKNQLAEAVANSRSDDWSSVAYWYQGEPHHPYAPMAPAAARLPRDGGAP